MDGRDGLGVTAAGAGVASLVVDVAVLVGGRPYAQGATTVSMVGLAEIAVLLTLTVLAVRRSRVPVAVVAGTLAGLAVPLWLLRFGPPVWSAEVVGGYTGWSMLAILAVAVGLYLRALDRRRTRAVGEARRAQRRELADDLHDFVVHDINEMLLQAQAGQVLLGGGGEAEVGAVLRRVEQAALRALQTVDRTVHLLQHAADGPAPRSPQPTANDLPVLVDRFAATGVIAAQLRLAPDVAASLPPEISTTAYRIVVEALTNVRRHATGASRVRVAVERLPEGRVRVEVADDGTGQGRSRHGGLGLAGLAARIDALGGTLSAGPAEPTGWRVTAVLPDRAGR